LRGAVFRHKASAAILDWLLVGKNLPGCKDASPLTGKSGLELIALQLVGLSANSVPHDKRVIILTKDNEEEILRQVRNMSDGRRATVCVELKEFRDTKLRFVVSVGFGFMDAMVLEVNFWVDKDERMRSSWSYVSVT